MSDVTRILSSIDAGDPAAAEQLLPPVYEELRKLAAVKVAHEKPGQTLQATALVHEAYVRLVGGQGSGFGVQGPGGDRGQETGDGGQRWNSRGHFFAAAAEAMRRILIERARRKGLGDRRWLPLDDMERVIPAAAVGLVGLDEALTKLEAKDPAAAQLVKLRFFAGLTMAQAAEVLGVPLRSAERNWTYARTWLQRELSKDADQAGG
jgi:DNA-directed RNA polymerase specialized sigma24 family protein